MFKCLIIFNILLLLGACNNKLVLTVPGKQVSTPAPYQLLGRSVASFGTGGLSEYSNPIDAARTSQLKYSVEKADGSRYEIAVVRNTSNAIRTIIFKIDGDTGAIDNSFGTGGYFEVPSAAALVNQHDNVWDTEFINDRYILMCGYEDATPNRIGFVKLFDTQTQAMVPTFGTAGILQIVSADGARPRAFVNRCRYDQQLNRIVISYTNYSGNLYRTFLKVMDFTGTDVAGFNGGTTLQVSHASLTGEIDTFPIVVTDQHYYVIGEQFDATRTYHQSYLAKYDKSGVLVNGFGTNGVKLLPASTDATNITMIEYLTDGKDGYFYATVTDHTWTQYRMVRISQSTGDLDLTFGTAGFADIRPDIIAVAGALPGFYGSDLWLTDDGKLLLAWADTFAGITQITKAGAVDPAFGTNGTFLLPTPAGATSAFMWSTTKNLDGTFTLQGETTVGGLRKMTHWKVE